MKNKELINNVMLSLDEVRQTKGDMEALKIYTTILEGIEIDINKLQERVRSRIENIL